MAGKEFFGVVTSDKMEKTLVVSVARRYKERRTGKIVSARKKYKIHCLEQGINIGDTVSFTESRAYSKDKKFRFLKLIKKTEMALVTE
ncbi:30S ribosomal protein S17 [bacterium]|nr:30S ribosomal protein S17 [bacterium]